MRKNFITLLSVAAFACIPAYLQAADGAELWIKNCKKCHGEAGRGDTPMGAKLSIRDYTDPVVQESFTDEEIHAAIVNGKKNPAGKQVMLAFGKKLSEEDVAALVAYVRSLPNE